MFVLAVCLILGIVATAFLSDRLIASFFVGTAIFCAFFYKEYD